MPDLVPEPVDNRDWRHTTTRQDPACTSCGHPLWALSSVESGLCAGCRPMEAFVAYDGPPELRLVSDGPRVPCRWIPPDQR